MLETISDSVEVHAPVERLFAFYTDLRNVVRMTPQELHLEVVRAETPLRLHSRVLFSVRPTLVPFEVRWLLVISEYKENELFTERLERGPFTRWLHRHEFTSLAPERSRVVDTIEFGPANGLLKPMLGSGFTRTMLRRSFDHRREVLRSEFPLA